MTQEEKLEEAKRLYETANADQKYVLESLFPELAESEDERIRKEIISALKWANHKGVYDKHIVWLEKQGEQKPADKVEPKFKVGQTIKKEGFNLGFTIVKIEDGFYYNDMGDHFPYTDQENWELVEQNPAWSEEDDYNLQCCIAKVQSDIDNGRIGRNGELLTWLNSLKERVHSKREWSEEDEAVWAEISDLLWEGYKQSGSKFSWDDIRNWVNPKLKSLRPQNRWKPSDTQMASITCAVRKMKESACYDSELVSLLNDLKKLMEE